MAQLITLTTDFHGSYYVGEMKGVVRKVNPLADVIDITHSVSRHNIIEGAFILSRIWRHFPKNTVHVAVVDPGVGSQRKAVAVETEYCMLIGPDNGVLRWALRGQEVVRVVELDGKIVQERAGLSDLSLTFHGRDVFAPAAALISKGADVDGLGRRVDDIGKLDVKEDMVVYVDSFGNIVTTVAVEMVAGKKAVVRHGGKNYDASTAITYSDLVEGGLVVLIGSHGLVEVGVNRGNAAERLGVKVGDAIGVEYVD
ncbi:MAG: SAM-dependent chlorinase/fluorinase [Candidatus Altiarchaeota archaeon]